MDESIEEKARKEGFESELEFFEYLLKDQTVLSIAFMLDRAFPTVLRKIRKLGFRTGRRGKGKTSPSALRQLEIMKGMPEYREYLWLLRLNKLRNN